MILLNETAYAIDLSVESHRANVIQPAQHRSPTTPGVRRRIVFFIERLIDKSIRISADYVHSAGHSGDSDFAARMKKRSAVMPTALSLQSWRLRAAHSYPMLLSNH